MKPNLKSENRNPTHSRNPKRQTPLDLPGRIGRIRFPDHTLMGLLLALTGALATVNSTAQSAITVPEGATARITANLRGNARFINLGTLPQGTSVTLSDFTTFDSKGSFSSYCSASGAATIINGGYMTGVFFNVGSAEVLLRNEGSFAGLFVGSGRILNLGTIANSTFNNSAICVTNDGVVNGTTWNGGGQFVNRGTWTGSLFKSADLKIWNSGTLDKCVINAQPSTTRENVSATLEISGGGSFDTITLWPSTNPQTNPPPLNVIHFNCVAGTNQLHIGEFSTHTDGPANVLVDVAPGGRMQADAMSVNGTTGFANRGLLTVSSNLSVSGTNARALNLGTLTVSNLALRDSVFVQSGTAYVASARCSGVAQTQINGPTAITNLTLEGKSFTQHNTNMHGSTMQIVATNGDAVGFQNDGLLQYQTCRITVTSPQNNGFINVQNNGTFDCNQLILLDDAPWTPPGVSGTDADLITFNNAGTIAGGLCSASTAGIGQVDINNWGQITPRQFVTNGNIRVWNGYTGGLGAQPALRDLRFAGLDEPSRGEVNPNRNPVPADAGEDISDSGFVLVVAGAQAAFGATLYGTMSVSNFGSYVITNGLRLHEQTSLVNTGAITGDVLSLSGQSTVTNAGKISLDRLQLDDTAGDAIAVRNYGQMRMTELLFSATATAVIECGTGGLFEARGAWLGQEWLTPFTLTNGQSLTCGGVSFVTSGNGIIRIAPAPVTLINSAKAGTNFCFWFQTQSNAGYTVQYNDDLRTTNWSALEAITGDGSLMPCLLPMTNNSQRFFRVRQP